MQNNQNNNLSGKFLVDERRRQVASMLAQSMTESDIAVKLGVDVSTISRDVKALKEMSQQFVFDLAKSDLAYYYKQCIDGIEEVLKKAWEMFNDGNLSPRDRLLALKVIRDSNESKFGLFERGPSILNVRSLEERLDKIEHLLKSTNSVQAILYLVKSLL